MDVFGISAPRKRDLFDNLEAFLQNLGRAVGFVKVTDSSKHSFDPISATFSHEKLHHLIVVWSIDPDEGRFR